MVSTYWRKLPRDTGRERVYSRKYRLKKKVTANNIVKFERAAVAA